MAHVVVLGAGLGGAIMAYELKDQLRPEDKVTVVTKDPKYHFVPSNPWIAVGWRDRGLVGLLGAAGKREGERQERCGEKGVGSSHVGVWMG